MTARDYGLAHLRSVESTLYLRTIDMNQDAAAFFSSATQEGGPALQLQGLLRLENDLAALMNEAASVQHASFSSLQHELARCEQFYSNNSHLWKHEGSSVYADSVSNGEDGNIKTSISSGDVLSSSSGGINSSSSSSHNQRRRAELASRQLQKWLQEVHDGASAAMDAKLNFIESISTCIDMYTRLLMTIIESKGDTAGVLSLDVSSSSSSSSSGSSNSSALRVAKIARSRIEALLSHRFLDEREAMEMQSAAKTLWASAFLHRREALADRKLIVNSFPGRNAAGMYMRMGAGATLLLWSFSECFNNEQIGREIWHDPTFAIFMCFGDLLLLLWMWGLSMQIWRASGIDFVTLLGLEGTEIDGMRSPELSVYTAATDLTLIFFAVFICFNKAVRGVFHIHGSLAFAHTLPVFMVIFFMYRILSPWETRRRWLSFLGQVVSAPLFQVCFRDGYVGDLLTSLVRVMIPMCYSIAYLLMSAAAFMTGNLKWEASTSDLWWQDSVLFRLFLVPVLTLLPLWIRLMQCLRRSVESGRRWPHMANAIKYTSAIAVISFGTFRPSLRQSWVWIFCFILATLLNYTWDLTMDWGVLVRSSSRSASTSFSCFGIALRETRLLGPAWMYFGVMAANLILRFAWTLTLLPSDHNNSDTLSFASVALRHMGPLVAAGEVMRRMVWGFFRLEHEQLEVLGTPSHLASVGSAALSGGVFDKMDVAAASSSTTSSSSGTSGGAGGGAGEGSLCGTVASVFFVDTEWLQASAPSLFSLIAPYNFISPSDGSGASGLSSKMRFVESVLFASGVLAIILLACISGIAV